MNNEARTHTHNHNRTRLAHSHARPRRDAEKEPGTRYTTRTHTNHPRAERPGVERAGPPAWTCAPALTASYRLRKVVC
eukprot:scaffold2261_cov130-Isochrysis_galbana.AAC.2